ncbi:MAG: MmgE/PrpD family protein [Bosea sp.]|nr:MmgE/PrpD family protein [Bosea sp. (in: a-proteobacteria)]
MRLGAHSFVDTFGVSIGAAREPGGAIAMDYATEGRCGGPATIWPTGRHAQPEDAALANGVLAHLLDYDHITANAGRGHPAVVLWPALVALGETIGATGRQLSAGFAVGYELFMMPGIGKILDHYARGHHVTSTYGLIAATAAAANLIGLDAGKATMAIGMAASHAAGLQANFGTMTKSLHAGIAASAAVRCVRLAARGFTASADALEGRQGFGGAYTFPDLSVDMDALGKGPLALGASSLSVKKFPCCLSVHIAVQTVLDMLAESAIPAADVASIRVAVEPRGLTALIHHRPVSGLQGKFSMEYCVAAALIDGALGLESFTDEAVQRPEAQALLRKVEAMTDGGDQRPLRAAVDIVLNVGTRLRKQRDRLPGSPQQPLSEAEMHRKFRDCVAYSGLDVDTDGFLAKMADWGDRPISSILGTISPAPAR